MNHYTLPEGNVAIAFSGGRTSAYMLRQIIDANGLDAINSDRVVVSFQNTGREMPETLDFVQECGERWGVRIVWLEYRPAPPLFEVVSHNSASRNGEPFEALIRKNKFIPSRRFRLCSSEMKRDTLKRYLRSIGWDRWSLCLGLRADEPSRLNPTAKGPYGFWLPMSDAKAGRHDVAMFWRAQPFDLGLPNINGNSWLGNCDGCPLKSEANLAALARDYPERHKWWEDMELMASEWTLGNGAQFDPEVSRRELRIMVERQGDWLFDTEGALCQASHGECTG